jgi:hypothetical protein
MMKGVKICDVGQITKTRKEQKNSFLLTIYTKKDFSILLSYYKMINKTVGESNYIFLFQTETHIVYFIDIMKTLVVCN